jgi:hypothetical protein
VRDNLGTTSAEASRLSILKTGSIRFNFLVPVPTTGVSGINNVLNAIKTKYLTATDSVEGSNDYDGATNTWVADLKAYQSQLFAMVKGDSVLKNLPVLGPSIRGNKEETALPALGNISSSLAYGNIHSYPSGRTPERTATNTSTDLESRLGLARQYSFSAKPYMVTESGYTNASNNCVNGHLPATERTAGIYMPRLFLEDFRLGASRTYIYELLDQGTNCSLETHFGMFNFSGAQKPAAVPIHNLTTLLADAGSFSPGSLKYMVTSGGADLRQVLLQKHDGSFWLALWRSSNEANAAIPPTDLSPPDQPLSIIFGQPIAQVTSYRPNVGLAATASVRNPTSASLLVGGQVELVNITPGSSIPVTPSPTPSATLVPSPSQTVIPTVNPSPIVHPTATPFPLPINIPGMPLPLVTGTVAVIPPGTNISKASIAVDGHIVPLTNDGLLNTDTLPNGDHTISVTTVDSKTGQSVTVNHRVTIKNKLTPWQTLQNALYLPLHGNKQLANSLIFVMGLAVLGVFSGTAYFVRRKLIKR